MNFYDMTWLERLLFLRRIKGGSGHEETTTSNTFVTDMVAPLRKLLLSFAPKQSGSGDPSPTNVRPISGWDGVSVTRCGSNLLNPNAPRSKGNFVSDDVINPASNTYVFGIRCEQNTSYTIYTKDKGVQYRVGLTEEYPVQGVAVDYLATRGNNDDPYTFNTADNNYIALATSSSAEDCANTMVIVGNDTASSYEPYAGQTYSVSWQSEAGTVYGGTIDVASGVLTVDTKCFEITELTLYGNYQSHPLYYCDIPNYQTEAIKRCALSSDEGMLVCDRFIKTTATSTQRMGNLQARTNENGAINRFYFRYDELDSLSDFNAELAVTPMRLVTNLATPQTYQLTPQQISTLIGTNVITTDANVEEIIYLKKAE